MRTPADVVLVHGTFLGPWIWEDVVGILHNAGVRAHAVDLPTVGARREFADDVAAVRAAVAECERDVVLVGHSYGGCVITEAAERAKHLVYLTGVVPDLGESMVDLSSGDSAEDQAIGEATTIPADVATALLFHDCARVRAAQAVRQLRPANPKARHHAVTRAAWRELPCTYVRGLQDRMDELVAPDFWLTANVTELPTGHCPQWSRPDLVANVLLDLA